MNLPKIITKSDSLSYVPIEQSSSDLIETLYQSCKANKQFGSDHNITIKPDSSKF